jgi:hypothetical protein
MPSKKSVTFDPALDIDDEQEEKKSPANSPVPSLRDLQQRLLDSYQVDKEESKKVKPLPKPPRLKSKVQKPGKCEELLTGIQIIKKGRTYANIVAQLLRVSYLALLGYLFYLSYNAYQQVGIDREKIQEIIEGIAAAFLAATYTQGNFIFSCNDYYRDSTLGDVHLSMLNDVPCDWIQTYYPANCGDFVNEYCDAVNRLPDNENKIGIGFAMFVLALMMAGEAMTSCGQPRQLLCCFEVKPEFFIKKNNLEKINKLCQEYKIWENEPFKFDVLLKRFKSVYQDKYATRMAVLSGAHPRVGENSPLKFFFRDPLFDRKLFTMMFSYVEHTPETRAFRARKAFASAKYYRNKPGKTHLHVFFKRMDEKDKTGELIYDQKKILRNIYEFAGLTTLRPTR